MKRIVAIALALLVLGGAAFAQNKTSLNIICNQVGAQVYINGRLAGNTTPNFSFLVPAGKVQVRVQKNGFKTYEDVLNVTGTPLTVTINLEAIGAATPTPPPPPPVVQHSLSINANVQGADIFVNGNPAGKTPMSSQVPPGTYSVTVKAPGFVDFNQTVVVNGATTVTATLVGVTFPVSIGANVGGAEVLLNGMPIGKAPFSTQLGAGSYQLTVRAGGYADFAQTLVVNGPTQVNATLTPLNYQLAVDATNYKGAQVLINGAAAGQTPFVGQYPPGTYSVTVRAVGFVDSAVTVALSKPEKVTVMLVPAPSTWQMTIPEGFANRDLKGGPASQVQLFIDGNLQKLPMGQITPGKHTIRIATGGLAVETVVDFQAGKAYSFEPSLGLSVK